MFGSGDTASTLTGTAGDPRLYKLELIEAIDQDSSTVSTPTVANAQQFTCTSTGSSVLPSGAPAVHELYRLSQDSDFLVSGEWLVLGSLSTQGAFDTCEVLGDVSAGATQFGFVAKGLIGTDPPTMVACEPKIASLTMSEALQASQTVLLLNNISSVMQPYDTTFKVTFNEAITTN